LEFLCLLKLKLSSPKIHAYKSKSTLKKVNPRLKKVFSRLKKVNPRLKKVFSRLKKVLVR